jgi:uncharacterized protein YecT (DUF1311 family)
MRLSPLVGSLLLLMNAAPLQAAAPLGWLGWALGAELRGDDKAAFERLMSYKSFKTEDKMMAEAYKKLLGVLSDENHENARESQVEWNTEKEKETVRILHRNGEDAALRYLTETTAARRKECEQLLKANGKSTKQLPDSDVKMPTDPDFKRVDAAMAAQYFSNLKKVEGHDRDRYVQEQRDWNLQKERQYLRLKEKSGSATALSYLIETTRERLKELR